MAWSTFQAGKCLGGIMVLRQTSEGVHGYEVRYDVECVECETRHEMTHKYIMARARKGVVGCVSCRSERVAEAARRGRRSTEMPAGAIQAGRHLWWPLAKGGAA